MKFVDAHIHLSDPEYNGKIPAIIEDAKQTGIVALVSNSMNLETSKTSLRLAQEHPSMVNAALGIHPRNANQLAPNELEQTINLIQQNKEKVTAIGEIGLDPQYAKRREQKNAQATVFHEMLKAAERLELPVIVHSRWSAQKILDTLPSYTIKGVLWHWFSGPVELLPKIVERGDYVSEGPPAAFSERIQEIVRTVPLERLLTETDGPVRYYGPFEHKPTTPAFIPEVIRAMARVKEVEERKVIEQILSNFTDLFNIAL